MAWIKYHMENFQSSKFDDSKTLCLTLGKSYLRKFIIHIFVIEVLNMAPISEFSEFPMILST